MKIKAAIAREAHKPLSIEEVEIRDPLPGEILVRLEAAGICHTDIVCRDQHLPVPLPAVLGHEGAGVVQAVGPGVSKFTIGDRVLLSYDYCATCDQCRMARAGYCRNFVPYNFGARRADGSTPLHCDGADIGGRFFGQSCFATHCIASERNAVKAPDDLPLHRLAPLGCGLQTGAGTVLNALRPEGGSSLVVFGCGAVGLAAVMAAAVVGCRPLIAVDLRKDRLELARTMGASDAVDASAGDPVAAVRAITGGRGVDYAVEATGVPKVMRQAADVLGPRGTCGVIGAAPIGAEVSLDAVHLLMSGMAIRGVIEGESIPDIFIPRLIELHRQGRFPMERMMRTYPFERINEAMDAAERGEVIKPVLTFA
jgi:aryl-alcohol dehydrogenase